MRIVYLGNNWLGWQVLRHLREVGDDPTAMIVHPEPRRRFGAELLEAAGLPPPRVFDGSQLQDARLLGAIRELNPDIAVSVLFGYILRPPFLRLFPRGVINLHPSYLPYNRGAYPNVWSIVEGTPAGVTLHYIDEGVDTGDIIAQRQVPVDPSDTGASLYDKLEREGLALFRDTWPSIKVGNAPRRPQQGAGTHHRTADVARIDRIELDEPYRARDLINVLRARTFAPYKGAYFESDGVRVYLRLEMTPEPAPPCPTQRTAGEDPAPGRRA